MYKIKNHLSDPNLKLCFPLLEIEEYRLLNGWSHDRKKGSSRYDRIPRTLLGEIRFERIEDYVQLIPYDLKDPFTAKDFGKAIGEKKEIASNVLHILNHLQVVERCGKAGNSYLYHVVEF